MNNLETEVQHGLILWVLTWPDPTCVQHELNIYGYPDKTFKLQDNLNKIKNDS